MKIELDLKQCDRCGKTYMKNSLTILISPMKIDNMILPRGFAVCDFCKREFLTSTRN